MTRKYVIFVPVTDLDEDALGYSGLIEWCYDHLTHQNVIVLTLGDVYLLEYRSEVLDIINEENDSMLREGEDDIVLDQEVKFRIRQRLVSYRKKILNKQELDMMENLVRLLDISIKTAKSLYFLF